MKTRTAFIIPVLLCAFYASTQLPSADSSSVVSTFRRDFINWAVTDAQAPENSRRGTPFDPVLATGETSGTLFENVVANLKKSYYDKQYRTELLPKLISQYVDKARRATTLREQRDVVHELLSHIPASHLGLLSKQTHRYVMHDLQGLPYPTFGFQLVNIEGKFYAFFVLEGGPALRAGLLPWDRIVTIDGIPVNQSLRLDWRSDDAYIADDRDPPVHYLIAKKGETIRIKVERSRGKFLSLTVPAENYSAFEAAKTSARVYRDGGYSIGYLHLWYIHLSGVPEFLREKLNGEFSDCHALILDLRGRGGNGLVIAKILDTLRAFSSNRNRPIIALLDRQSRSAKDVLAYEFKKNGLARLVGEPTAGAVIPATFADVGHETILMFPSFKLPRYTDILEFKPVEPDVSIQRSGPLSAGEDAILKAGLAEAARLLKASSKRADANYYGIQLKLWAMENLAPGFGLW